MNICKLQLSIIKHFELRNIQFSAKQSFTLQADVHIHIFILVLNIKMPNVSIATYFKEMYNHCLISLTYFLALHVVVNNNMNKISKADSGYSSYTCLSDQSFLDLMQIV